MDIKLYTLLILTIYIVKSTTNIENTPEFHITDYILSYETYHFEWNPTHFISKTLSNNKIEACTKNTQIPSKICIEYTSQKHGFIIKYKNNSFNFVNDHNFNQINYIHSNNTITFHNKYNNEINENDYDEINNEISPFQSPNPNARRLLKRAKCRVYLYGRSSFSRRKGGTFRRRRYKKRDLRKRGFRSGGVKSVKVRGSRCCTAKLYTRDNFRGRRVRFKYGSYSRIRSKRHRISSLGSMKVYCSRRSKRRRRSRRRRSRRRRSRRCPCQKCPCGGGGGGMSEANKKPIPILLGPMTGMLGHFGYSMHPVMPPQIAHMAGMNGNYGNGQGMPMMNHPMYGQPSMGSGYGIPPGQMMGMGNMGMNAGGMGMGGMSGMGGMGGQMQGGQMGQMGGFGGQMQGGVGGQTPVVHVYTDGAGEETEEGASQEAQRRRLIDNVYYGAGIKKCVVLEDSEICGSFYFGERVVTVDYTVGMKKFLRVDMDEPEPEVPETDELKEDIVMEFDESGSDSESSEDDVELLVMDDEFSDVMIEHEDYEIMRNERLFGMENTIMDVDEMETDEIEIDYVNTVVWMWNKHECNDNILGFMNMSVCTMGSVDGNQNNDIVIYNKYNMDISDEEEDYMFDMNEIRFNVRNIMDWDEIYNINMFNNRVNKKLCKVESVIKICVEMNEKLYVNGDINEMQISIEFL